MSSWSLKTQCFEILFDVMEPLLPLTTFDFIFKNFLHPKFCRHSLKMTKLTESFNGVWHFLYRQFPTYFSAQLLIYSYKAFLDISTGSGLCHFFQGERYPQLRQASNLRHIERYFWRKLEMRTLYDEVICFCLWMMVLNILIKISIIRN